MDKYLLTHQEWGVVKQHLPEGTTPEDAGFMLYHTPEQFDLLMRLRERWNTRR